MIITINDTIAQLELVSAELKEAKLLRIENKLLKDRIAELENGSSDSSASSESDSSDSSASSESDSSDSSASSESDSSDSSTSSESEIGRAHV